MTTEIERLKKRITDRLKGLERDTNKLFDMAEERGQLIDALAREKEQLEAKLEAMLCGECGKSMLECECDD